MVQIKQEILAATTSFLAISYIIIVNPMILSDAHVPLAVGVLATIAASVVGCLIMGKVGHAPLIITPGMGVNAFFTYSLVTDMGWSWHQAIAICLVASCLFIAIAYSPIIKVLKAVIPTTLKAGITVGIGLFLVVIGLEKSQLIVSGGSRSLLKMGSLLNPSVWVALLGLVLTLWLYLRKVKAAFLLGVLAASLAAAVMQVKTNVAITLRPSDVGTWLAAMHQIDFSGLVSIRGGLAILALTLILVFESLGLMEGILPSGAKFTNAFRAGALATFFAALFQTSPTVVAAESAAGIQAKGKTGIVATVAAGWFLLAAFLIPVLQFVPTAAIAPIIIITGAVMMQQLATINFNDLTEWLPAFFIIALIPLTNSIATGLAFGFIAYPLVKLFAGRSQEIHWVLWLLAAVFAILLVVENA